MYTHRLARGAAVAVTLVMSLAGAAPAQNDPIAPSHVPGEVLVRFRPGTPAALRALAAARQGGTIERVHEALDFAVLRVPLDASIPRVAAALGADRNVVWAEPNGYYYAAHGCVNCPQDPYLVALEDSLATGENQYGVFLAGVPWLWRQGGGATSTTKIAIVDTGIDDFSVPHPDIDPNMSAIGYDFVQGDTNPTDEGVGAALYGHGTHVAGIAAAAANTQGIAGVAYDARLMIVRVLDCTLGGSCPGSWEHIAAGIRWAADNGARVINLSLAGSPGSEGVRAACQYAIGKGAIVVAASGNNSAPAVSFPAAYPEVIAVGASDRDDHVASFSNSGPELDVVAPGVDIWSAKAGGGYHKWSGTSQATPFVSGVAAIVGSRSPAMKQLEMENYLRRFARPLAPADSARDGYGRLAFLQLQDWSDFPPPVVEAHHKNFLWEWLGRDASAEQAIADPLDADHRMNIGAPFASDGSDDGVFPGSLPKLPLLPSHLGGVPTPPFDYSFSVSRASGPRYGADPSKQLHVDTWVDWNANGTFDAAAAAAEHPVADHLENPATWGADTRTVPLPVPAVDEHILGNPLRVRTRLNYGSSSLTPDSTAKFGEVEDYDFVNFVEDFDTSHRVFSGGVYMLTDSWSMGTTDTNPCAHRSMWEFARSAHPAIGAPCNGFIEKVNVIGTPVMNWDRYTNALLRFWYCHSASACSPAGDMCRVRIDTMGVKTDIGPLPMGSGIFEVDLSGFCGAEAVIIEIVEQTDWNGSLTIDDVVVLAADFQRPEATTSLTAVRSPGSPQITLGWTAPKENDFAPSPPTEPIASTYDMRFSTAPITTEAEWDLAQRFDPREGVGDPTSRQPGMPGSSQGTTFLGPSAFQSYYVALRTGDEVVNASPISNSPSVTSTPTLGVSVTAAPDTMAAPGDTLVIPFTVTNTGNALDSYGITVDDTKGWELLDAPGLLIIPPGGSAGASVSLVVPVSVMSGERDTVTVTASSLADPLATSSDVVQVDVLGPTAVAPPAGQADLGVRVHRPIPLRAPVEFDLPASRFGGDTSLRVYDSAGRVVRTLTARPGGTERWSLVWDGADARGSLVPSGVYLVEMRCDPAHHTVRVPIVW